MLFQHPCRLDKVICVVKDTDILLNHQSLIFLGSRHRKGGHCVSILHFKVECYTKILIYFIDHLSIISET